MHEQWGDTAHSGQLLWCSTREDSRHSAAAAARAAVLGTRGADDPTGGEGVSTTGEFVEDEFRDLLASLR